MTTQQHNFQAEVAQVLHLVTHALYSNSEIFLRELISNASDACDKLRFEALENQDLYAGDSDLWVRISADAEANTLTIEDNGIGMSAEEAVTHLGTIAKSGTKEFVSRLSDSAQGDANAQGQLIGQFGVGFYSGFIVAERMTVDSRRAGLSAAEGVRWSSQGTGEFTTETITKPQRGTRITLHLREDAAEYTNGWKLRNIISRYADHISLPIQLEQEIWQEAEEEGKPGAMVKTGEWETVNQATALWARPKKDITDEQYQDFYQHISHDFAPPLAWSHHRVEGNTEYTQLLYIPSQAPFDLWSREHTSGIKLFVKRVFIMDEAQNLLPNYLRFVQGVVDAADLPLNVSRELLQESRDVKTIREGNTRRVLALLEDLAKNDAEKFATFQAQFGAVLKEGLGEDRSNQAKIAGLLRFHSSTEAEMTSLADYKGRMQEGQKAIYYLTAETASAAKNSPQLEIFKKKGIEVLLLSDRVDEWAMSQLPAFDDTPLQSIAKGQVDLGDLQDAAETEQAKESASQMQPVVERLKTALQDQAADVRVTTRLVDSPACLVVAENAMSLQMQRLLRQAGQAVPESKPVLEINPDHPLVQKLAGSSEFEALAHILFDQALLAEGGLPDDPAAFVRRINALLV